MKIFMKIIVIVLLSAVFISIMQFCRKPSAPTVTTATVSDITTISAVSGGNVTNNGGDDVSARGICWSTTSNPAISSSKTSNGTGNGAFTSSITGLKANTPYYVRAYATNSEGTAYGNELIFTTTAVISTVPDAPAIGTATKGNAQATIIFTAPASDGGSAITGYTVTSNPGSITGTGSASPITVTGLTNGTAYTFTVTATNANGIGPASSASNSVTPSTVPGSPIIGTAAAGNTQATIIFTAPASDGGSTITGYTVTSSPGGLTGTGSASPITVTGLTNGTAYTFTVTATNANGTGPASSASNSVTPLAVPGAPTIGTATKGNAQATITFTAPASNGGSAITGYTATSSPGGLTGTGTTSPITVTGLTNGTAYTFTVTATNANGTGLASSASNSVIPSTVPGAPTIGTATAGNAQAVITFTAPGSNGGSAITGYTVTSNPGGFTATGTASPITVTGLTNGTAYIFTVTATNVNGTGPASSASNSVTPSSSSLIYDFDGNAYNTISVGTQVWLAQNLKTTRYSNGDLIGTTNPSTLDITNEISPKYQWAAGNNENNVATYGRFYTWFVATDIRNVCPSGWHVPSDTEWETLKTYLGGESAAGGKIKETGTSHWQSPNTGATNETGFTAVAPGYRFINGTFLSLTVTCYFWSTTQDPAVSEYGLGQGLHYNDNILLKGGHEKIDGMTIRCFKN